MIDILVSLNSESSTVVKLGDASSSWYRQTTVLKLVVYIYKINQFELRKRQKLNGLIGVSNQ